MGQAARGVRGPAPPADGKAKSRTAPDPAATTGVRPEEAGNQPWDGRSAVEDSRWGRAPGRAAPAQGAATWCFLWCRRHPYQGLLLSAVLAGATAALEATQGRFAIPLYLLPVALGGACLAPAGAIPLAVAVLALHAWVTPASTLAARAGDGSVEATLAAGLAMTCFLSGALRASLARELRQKRLRQGLSAVSSVVASSLDLQHVLQTALAQAQRLARADPVAIWLLNREEQELVLAASASSTEGRRVRSDTVRITLGSGHWLARSVGQRGILVADARRRGPEGRTCLVGCSRTVAIPLIARGAPVGVLAAGLPEQRLPGIVSALHELATDAAIAIENARLYSEARRHAKTLEAMRLQLEAWSHELERRVEEKTEELREAHRGLLQAERLASIGELAAAVAHQFRNPLNVIRVAQFALARGCSPERQQRHLDAIARQVAACSRTVDALLEFAHGAPSVLEPVSLNQTVTHLLTHSQPPDSVRVSLDLDPQLPTVLADRLRLSQAIGNLLTNALQAMPEGGDLSVRTSADEGMVLVTVRDTGPGIPDDVRPRIFEPLFTTRAKGAGLGLAIARQIAEAHGGEIRLESKAGAGAAFTLALPLGAADRSEEREAREATR